MSIWTNIRESKTTDYKSLIVYSRLSSQMRVNEIESLALRCLTIHDTIGCYQEEFINDCDVVQTFRKCILQLHLHHLKLHLHHLKLHIHHLKPHLHLCQLLLHHRPLGSSHGPPNCFIIIVSCFFIMVSCFSIIVFCFFITSI